MKPLNYQGHIVWNRVIMISAPVILLILLVLVPAGAEEKTALSVIEHSAPVLNRSLTETEMMPPFDGYRRDFMGERTVILDFAAPRKKPEVQWSYKDDFFILNPVFLDSEGGSLIYRLFRKSDEDYELTRKLKPRPPYKMVRLNPDSSVSWQRYYSDIQQDHFPAVLCKGAVIWLETSSYFVKEPPSFWYQLTDFIKTGSLIPNDDVSLECIDNEGNVTWRTQSYKLGFTHCFSNPVWRISGYRIMLAAGKFNSGTYNIISISDGALLDTIKFPEWSGGVDRDFPLEPIEIPNRGWIGFQYDGIVLYDSSLKIVWKHSIAVKELLGQPVILKDTLIFSTADYLAALDINSGEITWKKTEYKKGWLHGAVPDNDLMFFTASSGSDKSRNYYALDKNGKLIISTPYKEKEMDYFNRYHNTIVYSDGSILFNDRDRLNLFDKNGMLIWNVSLNDLGFSDTLYTMDGYLSATTDNRLVFCISGLLDPPVDEDGHFINLEDDYIISLKTKD